MTGKCLSTVHILQFSNLAAMWSKNAHKLLRLARLHHT